MPPTMLSASSTVLRTSCLASSYAAVSPAGPAPMMITLVSLAAGEIPARLVPTIPPLAENRRRLIATWLEHSGAVRLKLSEAPHPVLSDSERRTGLSRDSIQNRTGTVGYFPNSPEGVLCLTLAGQDETGGEFFSENTPQRRFIVLAIQQSEEAAGMRRGL